MVQYNESTLRVQQLFVRHQGQLKAFLMSLWPDFAGVDDVLQEVFLAVTAKAADFQENTNFLAWARAIARYKLLEARRKGRGPTMDEDVLASLAATCPEDWGTDQKVTALARCLASLAPKAREIVQLRYHREHSPAEIAQILSRTVNSVAVALAKARVALRECIERQMNQEGA